MAGWFHVPYVLGSFFLADASLRLYGVTNLVGDTNTGGPCTKHNNSKIAQPLLRDVQTSHYRRERHAPCSLHVVIEAGNFRPPPVKKPPRCLLSALPLYMASLWTFSLETLTVVKAKVLEMDACLRIQLARRLDKGFNELVILRAPRPFLPETEVQGVL